MQRNLLPDWFTHPTKRRARRVNRRVRAFYLSRALTRQRLALWGGALLVGLAGVVLTWGSRLASLGMQTAYALSPWWMLVWTPLMFMLSLLIVQVYAPGAAGGGIAQTIATLERRGAFLRERFLTFRVAVVKMLATLTGISAGGTFGYEGPIIQVGAALTHSLGRKLGIHSENAIRTTILAGGAASVAAAFNTPLAGIVFAIEEMGRSFEPRASGIILTAVILAGLITMAAFGNYDYFGTTAIHFRALGGSQLAAVLLTGVICGAFGALAARAMLAVSTGSRSRLLAWRGRQPMLFAAVCGVLIALIGIATHGESFGTGYNEAHRIVTGNAQGLEWFGIVKLFTMLVSQISGVTGGVLAPSLAIGAGFGYDIGRLLPEVHPQAMALLGMVGFFAGFSRSPLTGLVVVMEMTESPSMIVPLMVTALIASGVSRQFNRKSLYEAQAQLLLSALAPPPATRKDN
ncbi:MAG: chloride channel protein [Laribacter sp.]|nr:chloride channel protein [Laribacter sp.]MBP9527969.1 chloride channel protein [Laribacter sp.]MBP9610050.1 chloride channel protein [Laribacter sp.]